MSEMVLNCWKSGEYNTVRDENSNMYLRINDISWYKETEHPTDGLVSCTPDEIEKLNTAMLIMIDSKAKRLDMSEYNNGKIT